MPRLRLASTQPRRAAMISMHTSPLAQPGTGDAGGMNVYIDSVARALTGHGVEVEVFTRATGADLPPTVTAAPGYRVHHLAAGPYQGLGKDDLPGQLCAFTAELMRHEAHRPAGTFDIVHSHYWLSGQVGWVAASRWDVPWVHTMHTLARVKNAFRADDELPEPAARILGEDQIVAASDLLIANTAAEADDLVRWYEADPEKIDVVHPGVDLQAFVPGDRRAARLALGVPQHKTVLLFVGRLQPLKAPDVLLRAVGELLAADPDLARNLQVVVCGGPSGSAALRPGELAALADRLGIGDVVRFEPPVGRDVLADWYRAADLTVVPSYNESFGLVAVESQAVGTPVVAAAVGGLLTAVDDGVSGVLVPGHDPARWAQVLAGLIASPARRARLSRGAVHHAQRFSWSSTAQQLLTGYRMADYRLRRQAALVG